MKKKDNLEELIDKWMQLEDIKFFEISLKHKFKYFLVSLIWAYFSKLHILLLQIFLYANLFILLAHFQSLKRNIYTFSFLYEAFRFMFCTLRKFHEHSNTVFFLIVLLQKLFFSLKSRHQSKLLNNRAWLVLHSIPYVAQSK